MERRHEGVSGDAQGVVPEAELISDAAKRAHANKQKRDRAKRRKHSLWEAGETPHPQHQKIQKISGDAVTSAVSGKFEDIGTVTKAIKKELTAGKTIQRNVRAAFIEKIADRAARPAALRLDDDGGGVPGDTSKVTTWPDALNGIKLLFLNDDVTIEENARVRVPTRSGGFTKCREQLIRLSEGTLTDDDFVQWEAQLQVVDVLIGCCNKGSKMFHGVPVRQARSEEYAAGVARQFDALHRLASDTPAGETADVLVMGTQAGILASMLLDAKEGGPLIWPIKSIRDFTMPYETTTGDMAIKVVFDGVGSVRLAMFQHYASMMADDKPGSSVARFGNLMTHLKDPGYHSHLAMTALNRKPNQKCHRNQRASA